MRARTMIHDLKIRSEIARKWGAVKKLCTDSRTYLLPGCGIITESTPDALYNLPFMLAYAVFDEVLSELITQGDFICADKNGRTMNRPTLGPKMEASKKVLPWKNFSKIDEGKEKRNSLAHEAKLLSKAECLASVDLIEIELKAWGVI
jgi:hypothetical protein